jgi:hypothetical protein
VLVLEQLVELAQSHVARVTKARSDKGPPQVGG